MTGVILFPGMTGRETERQMDTVSSLEDKIEALERRIDNLERKIDQLDYSLSQYGSEIIDRIEDVEDAVKSLR
jgi:chaperonin cofactor prefoldin